MNGRVVDQRQINFIQYLEKEYKVDIRTTADYVEIRKKWISEGSRVPKPKIVKHRRSQSVQRVSLQRIGRWNFKANPIKWEDTLG